MNSKAKTNFIKWFIKRVLPLVLTLLILIILLSQISLQDIAGLLDGIVYHWVYIGSIFYLITNVFRAFRIQALLPSQKIGFLQLMAIMIAQSMFNNILPARMGEISFVYLLNKQGNIPADRSIAALLIARIFDFLAVALLFIVAALLSLNDLPAYATNIIWLVVGLLSLLTLTLLSAVWLGRQSLKGLEWLLIRLNLRRLRPLEVGLEKLNQVVGAFAEIHAFEHLFPAFVWSILVWVGTFAWFYAFLQSISMVPTIAGLVIGSTFAVLSKAVPFISVGGLGAHEAGWTLGFLLVGFDRTLAILSGLAVNLLTMIVSLILGGPALLILKRWRFGQPSSGQVDYVDQQLT